MKVILNIFLILLMIAGFFAIVAGWYLGVPYLAYVLIEGHSYTLFLSIWLGILLVKQIYYKIEAQNKLKKYEHIHRILGGKK